MIFSLKASLQYGLAFIALLFLNCVQAHDMRDRTRIKQERPDGITAAQAVSITLTLVETAPQALQTWVRTAATVGENGKILTSTSCHSDAILLREGQRIRAFSPDSKASIYQARVIHVDAQTFNDNQFNDSRRCFVVTAKVLGQVSELTKPYVMEVIVPRGYFLAIPKEAIFEESGSRVVYVERHTGHYQRREIKTGLEDELYTEVSAGLSAGEKVVTIGSFFVDAAHKLKSSETLQENVHHHH